MSVHSFGLLPGHKYMYGFLQPYTMDAQDVLTPPHDGLECVYDLSITMVTYMSAYCTIMYVHILWYSKPFL